MWCQPNYLEEMKVEAPKEDSVKPVVAPPSIARSSVGSRVRRHLYKLDLEDKESVESQETVKRQVTAQVEEWLDKTSATPIVVEEVQDPVEDDKTDSIGSPTSAIQIQRWGKTVRDSEKQLARGRTSSPAKREPVRYSYDRAGTNVLEALFVPSEPPSTPEVSDY